MADTLVIQTAFLGDVILTTPLLAVLAERHGPLDVVTTPGAAPLLRGHPAVHRVIPHDKRGTERGPRGIATLAARLRASGYRRAYLPHQSWRSGLAARLAGIPERIGFDDAPARLTYTRRIPRPTDTHEVDRILALAEGGSTAPISLGLSVSELAEGDAWLEQRRLSHGFVALAPGSVWATKRWGKYPALATALAAPLVVLGGPEERELGEAVIAGCGTRAVNAAGTLPLRISAAVLSRAAVLVTNDSAPLHMAQATGTTTIALFGPTVTAFGFGPRGPRDLVLQVDGLECRPCSAHGPQRCPLVHHRCMQDLELARVTSAVRDALTFHGTRHT